MIDRMSPTNDKKKHTFNVIVQNKQDNDEILSIVIEMIGNSMEGTVNTYRQMMMENVI